MLEGLRADGAYVVVVSDALEIVLFGTYTIVFTAALILLLVYRRPLPVDWHTVMALVVLYGTCMTHCSLVTTNRYSTLTSAHSIPKGPELSGLLRGTDALLKVSGFLSQLMMIHRCWAVWDYAWLIVVAPFLMAIVGFGCAMVGPIQISAHEFHSPFMAPRLLPFDIAFCTLSLVVDIYVTALIIYRLHHMSAAVKSFKSVSDLVSSLAASIIEAGALLSIAQSAVLISLLCDHPVTVILESMAAQVYVRTTSCPLLRTGPS
ncbi:hypothetical protein BD413DRAFT_466909 [Trametes elegans]|nr:hypothetical protein BD413DRAFT_466909 [Trametes elegans]